MAIYFTKDEEVVVFGEFEGVVVDQSGELVTIYCPAFNEAEPFLVTHANNVISVEWPVTSHLLN